MTKDELLAIYNSPAYRSAKYNYVWKDDDKAITSFWSDYETRKQRETEAALNKANAELEKKAIKEEQDAANQRQLLEDYQTASTKVANAEILWDAAVKEKGSNSADARTAKNNLSEALWFKNHIAQQLGYEPNTVPTTDEESTSDEVTPSDEESTSDVANKAQDLANAFKVMTNPTVNELNGLLKQIAKLENEQNIVQETKNSLADLKTKINGKINAINKAASAVKAKAEQEVRTKEQIAEAIKNWRNRKNLVFLQKQGYRVKLVTGGKNVLVDKEGNVVKEQQ